MTNFKVEECLDTNLVTFMMEIGIKIKSMGSAQ